MMADRGEKAVVPLCLLGVLISCFNVGAALYIGNLPAMLGWLVAGGLFVLMPLAYWHKEGD